ncbi:MAG: ribbon-helix-helix domain-containing protein [Hyphomicrobiales bacterium]|nr:ribbon-helix-helix domain-containing protein [Hyphomicrobiales bacterium]
MSADPTLVTKHSVIIAGHATSISLEHAFWQALRNEAARRGMSRAALIGEIDAQRGKANLSSALRVHLLERAALNAPVPSPPVAPA